MKKVVFSLFALSIVVSTAAFAKGQRSIVVAAVESISQEISQVQVFDNGTLEIQLDKGGVVRKRLSTANQNRIDYLAYLLAHAEIETKHHQVVCMMVLSPYLPMLKVSETDSHSAQTGVLFDVLSESNCAMHMTIAPKDEFHRRRAQELKGILISLANEFANQR